MTTADEQSKGTSGTDDSGVPENGRRKQTLEDVLVHGEEPTAEFLEEFAALSEVPKISDEDLTKQALNHPGADGNASTPE